MTFGEILAKVEFLIWGNSTPPAGSVTALSGASGIIANVHRKLMQEYNYWFMETNAVGQTTAGTNAYTLPTTFKQIISVQFKTEGDDYFQPPLAPYSLAQAQIQAWPLMEETADYPFYFEIYNGSIVFYPTPANTNYDYHMVYWQFLTGPTASFTSTACSEYSAFTTYGGDAISYFVATEMLQVLDEFQKADIYSSKGNEYLELLKNEDRARRQNYISEMHPDLI